MWIIVVLIALVAPARADATWDQVAALAKPTAKRGSAKPLAAAMAIAGKHDREWSDNVARDVGVSAYPEGAPALAALVAWRKDNGGLPPEATPLDRGKRAFQMMRLGQLAIATADVEHRGNLEVAIYLANTMVEDGDNLLVVTAASSLFDDAKARAKKLAVATDKWPAVHGELVRIVAAEALSAKATAAWMQTPAGKQAMDGAPKQDAQVGGMTPATAATAWAKLDAFYRKALDGAKRGEPADATLARLHAAAAGDPVGGIIERGFVRLRDKM